MVETPTKIIDLSDEYELDADELAFFKAQTKIQDDEEVKSHIATVQAKALKVYPYPCIKRMGYVVTADIICLCGIMWEVKRLRVTRVPAYQRVLQLVKERQDAIWLDVGCCCKCLCLYPVGYMLTRTLSRKRPPKGGSRWMACKERDRI